jgi:AraC-like DNA-binding protein
MAIIYFSPLPDLSRFGKYLPPWKLTNKGENAARTPARFHYDRTRFSISAKRRRAARKRTPLHVLEFIVIDDCGLSTIIIHYFKTLPKIAVSIIILDIPKKYCYNCRGVMHCAINRERSVPRIKLRFAASLDRISHYFKPFNAMPRGETKMIDYLFHYLPVSDLAIKWGLYLTGGGRGNIPPGKTYPPSAHPSLYQLNWNAGRILPEFQLILITEGRGEFETEQTGKIALESDSIILLFPGVWHRYRPDPATGWTERWISFHGDISHRLLDLEILSPAKAVWNIRHPQHFARSFDRLLNGLDAKNARNPVVLSFRAMSLLAEASELLEGELLSLDHGSRTHFDDVEDPLVAAALELIWTTSHRLLSVDQLARQLSVVRRTLDRRFRAVLGQSVLEEINRCRLSRAKRLLEDTVLPLKTIARLAGFTDAERMRVVFSTLEKTTPSDYRKIKRRA